VGCKKAAEPGYFPDLVHPKAAVIGPAIRSTFQQAYKAGVKIASGTDSGVSVHGENAHEFELMVEGGMPPMEAIQSATLQAARLLKIEDTLARWKLVSWLMWWLWMAIRSKVSVR